MAAKHVGGCKTKLCIAATRIQQTLGNKSNAKPRCGKILDFCRTLMSFQYVPCHRDHRGHRVESLDGRILSHSRRTLCTRWRCFQVIGSNVKPANRSPPSRFRSTSARRATSRPDCHRPNCSQSNPAARKARASKMQTSPSDPTRRDSPSASAAPACSKANRFRSSSRTTLR